MSKVIKIYEALSDIAYTEKIFFEIAKDKVITLIKAKGLNAFPAVFLEYQSPQLILTPEPFVIIEHLHLQKISAWFEHNEYLYIFESIAQIEAKKIILDLNSGVIFQQQKRAEFRFEIPPAYQATFSAANHNQQPCAASGRLVNISATGALLSFEHGLDVSANDTLHLILSFANHQPVEIETVVRHCKKQNEKTFVGAEFKFKSTADEKNIQNLIFHLRIELYDRA